MAYPFILIIISSLLLLLIQCSPIIPLNTSSILIDHLTNDEYDATEVITKDSVNSNMLMYYAYFTSMGYCREPDVSQGKCCGYILKANWEMVDHGVDPSNPLNNFILLKSYVYKKFIFAFPGTRGGPELTEEILKGYLVPIEGKTGMKVCSFFRERTNGLNDLVFTEANLAIIRSHEGYEVLFVGHSLGGALASILSLRAVMHNLINPTANPLVLFTINMPRPGNDIFANEVMTRIPNVFRLVRKGDLVSNVPPCIMNLRGKCQTIFDSDEFNLEPAGEEDPDKISFYYWHIGGLILMNEEMTQVVRCPINQGENFEADCRNTLTFNITLHNYIFNKQYGIFQRCSTNQPTEEGDEDFRKGYLE